MSSGMAWLRLHFHIRPQIKQLSQVLSERNKQALDLFFAHHVDA